MRIGLGISLSNARKTGAVSASLPIVAFNNANPDRALVSGTQALGTSGRYMTLAIIGFKLHELPAANLVLFGLTSGNANVRVLVLTDGTLQIPVRTPAAASIGGPTMTAKLAVDTRYDIFYAMDADAASAAAGATFYVNDASAANTNTWAGGSGVTIGYGTAAAYQFGGQGATAGATNDFDGEIARFALNAAARLDITDQAVRDTLRAEAALATWALDLSGPAAAWNAAEGVNRGTGPKFFPGAASAVVDVGNLQP